MAEIETYRKRDIKFRIASRDGAISGGSGKGAQTSCFWCAQTFRIRSQLTLDRLIPKSLGGTNAQANLVLACKPCNNRRDHFHPTVMTKALAKLEENLRRPEYARRHHAYREEAIAEYVRREYCDGTSFRSATTSPTE